MAPVVVNLTVDAVAATHPFECRAHELHGNASVMMFFASSYRQAAA